MWSEFLVRVYINTITACSFSIMYFPKNSWMIAKVIFVLFFITSILSNIWASDCYLTWVIRKLNFIITMAGSYTWQKFLSLLDNSSFCYYLSWHVWYLVRWPVKVASYCLRISINTVMVNLVCSAVYLVLRIVMVTNHTNKKKRIKLPLS